MPRRGRKSQEPKPVEWERLLLVEKLIHDVISEAKHGHLERAQVVALGKPRAPKAGGCDRVVKLRRPSKALNAMVKDDVGEIHYLVEIGMDEWDRLDTPAKKRLLDHALCHAGGLDDRGRWFTVPDHDVEEFAGVLERHGPVDTAGSRAVAKQLSLLARGRGGA
jgi:hypothetical protein